MIGDAATIADEGWEADICIVGGGAAGLTLAARLARSGCRILLLEAGGDERTDAAQDFYAGEVADPAVHWPLDTYRVRALGGTSTIWGGRSIPYDPIDFAPRAWVPHSGWPIGYDEVAAYYPAAMEAAEAGAFDQRPSGPIVPGLESEWLHTTIERFSRPTDFWVRYRDELVRAPNVLVVRHAAATAVRLTPDGARVDHVEVTLPGGERRRARARDHVLAAGGLETTRLLLASRDVLPAGIGNAGDWLGRGYMCHLAATFGEVTFTGDPRGIGFDYERDGEGIYIRRRLALTERAQRELEVMNFTARLHIFDANDPAHGDPVLSLIFLAAFAVKYEYSRAAREADRSPAIYTRHLANIARNPVRLARFLSSWGAKRYLASRRIPSIALPARDNRYPLEFHCEQAPNPESRITLSDDCDAFGMPRLRVDWRVTPLDFRSVRDSYRLMQRELARTGTGRLVFDDEGLEAAVLKAGAYGGHHSGATRMAASPADGVVDGDCRVHGVENLFVASASVLPTSSQANPTLTVLALALRLADHLEARARPVPLAARALPAGSPVVVTGAAGFVGRAAVRALAAAGHRVAAGVRRSATLLPPGDVTTAAADVLDAAQLERAFAGMKTVVHCAVGDARDTSVIVDGTRNVLAAARAANVRHVVHLSSVAVYGAVDGIVDEDAPTDTPQGAYGAAKVAAESLCRDAAAAGLAVTVLRPSLIYGPDSEQWTTLYVERLRSGRWPALGVAGEGACNLIHVDDLAAFIVNRVEARPTGFEVFNVNGADIPTWNGYLEALNAALGLPPLAPGTPPGRGRIAARKLAKAASLGLRKLRAGTVARPLDRFVLTTPSADEVERFASGGGYAIGRMQRAGFTPAIRVADAVRRIADARKRDEPL